MDAGRGQFQLKSVAFKGPSVFPPPHTADEAGLVGWGGTLNIQSLLDAYTHGIFPWPHEGYPLLWFSPPERGVLDFSNLHVPRSLEKLRKKTDLRFTLNLAFEEVMRACALVPRKGQSGTWITKEMLAAYSDLHRAGFAHSVEARRGDQLVGGIYGVHVSNYFSAESMFGHESNVSKLCLWHLIEVLRLAGLGWMDIQMVTSVTKSFGGHLIPRGEFLQRIRTRP